MKVSNLMRKNLITVSPNDSVKKVVKLIYNLGLKGIPVVENKKLVGLITEEDILTKLFPSINEYMEDMIHNSDFEVMEKKITLILNKRASEIMNPSVKTVTPDTPLMAAQSMILINKFSRLLITNNKKQLVGIVSQGDIFRALTGSEIPFDNSEEFREWLAKNYDSIANWPQRLDPEMNSLDKLFKTHRIEKIADIISGTSEPQIALANKGYYVTSFEKSRKMTNQAIKKLSNQPYYVRHRTKIEFGEYNQTLKKYPQYFDAAIFLGNGYPYNQDWKLILKNSYNSLKPKGIVIIQVKNFKKLLTQHDGFNFFNQAPSHLSSKIRYSLFSFFSDLTHKKDKIMISMSILIFNGNRWVYGSTNSTEIINMTKDLLELSIKKTGFKNIKFFGSINTQTLFDETYDENKHNWLNIVAEK